jgi:hypothetical protein
MGISQPPPENPDTIHDVTAFASLLVQRAPLMPVQALLRQRRRVLNAAAAPPAVHLYEGSDPLQKHSQPTHNMFLCSRTPKATAVQKLTHAQAGRATRAHTHARCFAGWIATPTKMKAKGRKAGRQDLLWSSLVPRVRVDATCLWRGRKGNQSVWRGFF